MATINEERLFSMLIDLTRVSISLVGLARQAGENLPDKEKDELNKEVRECHALIDELMKAMKEFRDGNN